MIKRNLFKLQKKLTTPINIIGIVTSIMGIYGWKFEILPIKIAVVLVFIGILTFIFYRFIIHHHKNISGIIRFAAKRSDLSDQWWEAFYNPTQIPKEVVIMGQTMIRAFKNQRIADNLVSWSNQGVKVHILLLSPEYTGANQLWDVSKGMLKAYSNNQYDNLRKKIYESIRHLEQNYLQKVTKTENKPAVRYATVNLPFSLTAIDGDMVITLYGTEAEADLNPTIVIKKKDSLSFTAFMNEFRNIWKNYSKVYPYQNPLLQYYISQWNQWGKYTVLRDYDKPVLPPRQAIFFITYHCKVRCSFCMYQTMNHYSPSDTDGLEIDPGDFISRVREFIALGVKHIEISGGGEPLEHSKIYEIIELLKLVRKDYPAIQFGLLTNGLELSKIPMLDLLYVFNEYIRISRCEFRDGELEIWRSNICKLLESKISNPDYMKTKVSIKYLLTKENKDKFMENIFHDLSYNNRYLMQADYFRFTSDRRLIKENIDIPEIEQKILYFFQSYLDQNDLMDKLSLGLTNFVYPINFKCWLSPVSVVIDPRLNVYICCNYAFDLNSKGLGSLQKRSFKDVWESPNHLEKRKKLGVGNCNRDEYCNCRFAEVQTFIDKNYHLYQNDENYRVP